jgi:hypothetical protein
MSDESLAPPRLSGDQVLALKFAAHRQLARWSNRPKLSPHQHGQRSALKGAVQILQDPAFIRGCDLRVPDAEDIANA